MPYARHGVWIKRPKNRPKQKIMSRKRSRYSLINRALLLSGAQIRALQERFEREREQWESQRPALERAATRAGKVLEMIREVEAIESPDFAPIILSQTLSYRFKRVPTVPKLERPTCGARTRSGKPCCARVATRPNGTLARRCRLHGGLSTGPKTKTGRDAIGAANRARSKGKCPPLTQKTPYSEATRASGIGRTSNGF